jgi:hypothetical protein
MKSILSILTLPIILVTSSCKKEGTADTAFARETFISLAKGEESVKPKIDWLTLTSQGTNVGNAYNLLPTEAEKQQFQTAFITSFASAFRDSGGSVESFTNWRVTYSDVTRTEVTADSPGGGLRLTVSERDSVNRISAIDITK